MLQSLTKILFVWVPLIQKGGLIQIKGKWKFVVMQGTKQENLYIHHGSSVIGFVSNVSQSSSHMSNDNSLWHMRHGHMLSRETVGITCYHMNRSPSIAIDFKTPVDVWSNKLVEYSMLNVFGCSTYYHVSKGKLEP